MTITNNIDQPQTSVLKSIYVPNVEGATAAWTYTETCTGATLQPDESCTVTFTFTPHTEGSLIQLAALNLIGPYTADNWVTLRGVGGTLPPTTTTTTVLVPPEQALRADVSAVDFGTGHVLLEGDADERGCDGVAGGLRGSIQRPTVVRSRIQRVHGGAGTEQVVLRRPLLQSGQCGAGNGRGSILDGRRAADSAACRRRS